MLILGIDDAGRGPLIGPMVLAGVLMTKEQESKVKSLGATDSKLLSHPRRVSLSKQIVSNSISHYVVESSADEIDSSITFGTNLNTLEAKEAAEIINSLNSTNLHNEKITVIVDCPSVNTLAWKNTMMSFVNYKNNLDVKCEHKADFKYPVVSAASILAKVRREEAVSEIKKKYGDIGSGYPSDPATKEFLRSHGKELKDSGIFRKTWATWRNMFPELALSNPLNSSSKQKKLF